MGRPCIQNELNGTLAIRGNRMGAPCDWSKETLGFERMDCKPISILLTD